MRRIVMTLAVGAIGVLVARPAAAQAAGENVTLTASVIDLSCNLVNKTRAGMSIACALRRARTKVSRWH